MSVLEDSYLRLMARTRISHKLLLASCATILPLAVLLWFVVSGFSRQIGAADAEMAGIRRLEPLQRIAAEISRHNRLTLDLRSGAASRADWDASTHRIDADMEAAARLSAAVAWFAPLQAQWARLRSTEGAAGAAQIASQHTQFFRNVHEAIREVADNSGLILDPDLDSYYLVDIVTNRIPALETVVNDAMGFAGQMAERAGASNQSEGMALHLEGDQIGGILSAYLRRSVDVAIRGNAQARGSDATLRARLPRLLEPYERSLAQLSAAVQNVSDARQASAIAALADQASRNGAALWAEALSSARAIVEERMSSVRSTRLLAFSLTLLAMTVAIFLILRVSSTLGWFLGEVVSLDAEIASGRLERARERLRHPRVQAMLANAERQNGAVRDEMLILLRASQSMTATLDSVVQEVGEAGARVGEGVHHIAAAVQQLEATISEQAASTNQVSTTTTEIVATTRDLARTMENLSRVAGRTSQSADSGLAALQQIHATMEKLTRATEALSENLQSISAKTRDVDEVITAITKVANRTNLLSLNAAIEAERGGSGTGAFSVVSLEIRRLADQTAASALDIEALITEMQAAVQAGVLAVEQHTHQTRSSSGAVEELSVLLSGIIESTREVAPQFDVVNSGMQAQAQAAGQISEAIAQLRDAAQQTRGSVAGFQSVAGAMRAAAGELERAVGRFSVS